MWRIAIFFFLPGLLTGQTPAPTEWTTAELIGLNEPSRDQAFTLIPAEWSNRDGLYLRREAAEQFVAMAEAARLDGVNLIVVSAARNFTYQNGIWSRKWARPEYAGWSDVEKARHILRFSAMPGSSRHHWGTEVDLNSLENDWFLTGEGLKVGEWLDAHAAAYGYHQVYTDRAERPGYLPERWHWSYLPLARSMLQAYNECIDGEALKELDAPGLQLADTLHILRDFVNGVDQP